MMTRTRQTPGISLDIHRHIQDVRSAGNSLGYHSDGVPNAGLARVGIMVDVAEVQVKRNDYNLIICMRDMTPSELQPRLLIH